MRTMTEAAKYLGISRVYLLTVLKYFGLIKGNLQGISRPVSTKQIQFLELVRMLAACGIDKRTVKPYVNLDLEDMFDMRSFLKDTPEMADLVKEAEQRHLGLLTRIDTFKKKWLS